MGGGGGGGGGGGRATHHRGVLEDLHKITSDSARIYRWRTPTEGESVTTIVDTTTI